MGSRESANIHKAEKGKHRLVLCSHVNKVLKQMYTTPTDRKKMSTSLKKTNLPRRMAKHSRDCWAEREAQEADSTSSNATV